jgi:hypothetical protein
VTVKVDADEHWAHSAKPWQGATPHPHGGAAEPGDEQSDRERDEDYAVNESNVNVDHVVNKGDVHVIAEDVNNADVNNVRKDVQEKPEKRGVVDNIKPKGKHNDEKTVEEQVHEKPEERDGTSSSSFTYYIRQSSTKTEAVARYVEIPVLNQLV